MVSIPTADHVLARLPQRIVEPRDGVQRLYLCTGEDWLDAGRLPFRRATRVRGAIRRAGAVMETAPARAKLQALHST